MRPSSSHDHPLSAIGQYRSPKRQHAERKDHFIERKPIAQDEGSEQHQNETWPRRRKLNVLDLELDMMTTVDEIAVDFPMTPDRVLGCLTAGESRLNGSSIKRIGMIGRSFSHDSDGRARKSIRNSQVALASERSDGRASSVLLPSDLVTLPATVFGSNPDFPPTIATTPAEEVDEKPPMVPPKSPRTIARLGIRHRKVPSFASRNESVSKSANSSVTSLHSAINHTETRSETRSESRTEAHFPPRRDSICHGLPQLDTSLGHQRDLSSTTDVQTPYSRGLIESPECISNYSSTGTTLNEWSPLRSRMHGGRHAPTKHLRGSSEASVLHRGRPMGRGDMSLQRSLSKPMKQYPSIREPKMIKELPLGVSALKATDSISFEEIDALKQEAEVEASFFEVLYQEDVNALSEEMRLLEQRCAYLRRTYSSLKEGRRDLHARMIDYLQSPRTASFSRENMLKQELALVELDESIDEWLNKLEEAEARKMLIRKKLLEHTAATLTVKPLIVKRPLSPSPEEHPDCMKIKPQSIRYSNRSFSIERRDVESIRVYADLGVASLLADIEREIATVERSSSGWNSTNDVAEMYRTFPDARISMTEGS